MFYIAQKLWWMFGYYKYLFKICERWTSCVQVGKTMIFLYSETSAVAKVQVCQNINIKHKKVCHVLAARNWILKENKHTDTDIL